jgi:hypothetical protein
MDITCIHTYVTQVLFLKRLSDYGRSKDVHTAQLSIQVIQGKNNVCSISDSEELNREITLWSICAMKSNHKGHTPTIVFFMKQEGVIPY